MKKLKFYLQLILITSFLLTTRMYSQSCPAELISYWKMNETSGLTLIDQAGGHDALCNKVPDIDPNGRIGSAHFFVADSTSGVTSTVLSSADYNFPAHSSFTIIYWFKVAAGDLDGRDHVIVSRGNYHEGNPLGAFWSSGIGLDGNLNFILQDSATNRLDIQTPLGYADGMWHQAACVRDENSKTNTLYVDGMEAVNSTQDYSGSFSSSEPVQFCQLKNTSDNSDSFGYFYRGSLDEVAIFKTALTSNDLNNQIMLANVDVGICDGFNANLISTPVDKAIVGSEYSYKVHAGGLQNGMSYSLVSGPEGMVIDSLTGLLSWTPIDIKTQAAVSVIAQNYLPPADTQTFRIYLTEGTPCPDNQMVLLKLDEDFGPVYSDYYVLHNAVANVSPVATEGIIGGAQLFNATSELDIPDINTEFNWAKDASFSYEYWLRTSTQAMMICVARHRLDTEHTAFMSAGTDETGRAMFELRDNKNDLLISKGTTMIADGNWHYIVDVRNGATNENIIFVDGSPESVQSFTYDSSFQTVVPTPINIGYLIRNYPDEPGYHFLGSIDEVAIYNRAINAEEALNNYNHGQPINHCGTGNFAPFITSQPVTKANANYDYSYILTAEDIDTADVLTMSAIDMPQWLTFSWQPGEKTASLSGIPTSAGQYPVLLRVSDGKVDIDQKLTIVVSDGVPTMLNDLESEGILIYPVPARDQLIILVKDPKSQTQLEIINGEGKILRQAVINIDEERQIFGLNDIANGTYFLHVQNDKVSKTQSFIIAR
jgi:hypothetical protein